MREALRKAEKEVEYLSSEMSSSLQKWLQITYQKEVKNFQYRRIVAMKKMEEAKDAVGYSKFISKICRTRFPCANSGDPNGKCNIAC